MAQIQATRTRKLARPNKKNRLKITIVTAALIQPYFRIKLSATLEAVIVPI